MEWARATDPKAKYCMIITGFRKGARPSQDRWIASYTDPVTQQKETYEMKYAAVKFYKSSGSRSQADQTAVPYGTNSQADQTAVPYGIDFQANQIAVPYGVNSSADQIAMPFGINSQDSYSPRVDVVPTQLDQLHTALGSTGYSHVDATGPKEGGDVHQPKGPTLHQTVTSTA